MAGNSLSWICEPEGQLLPPPHYRPSFLKNTKGGRGDLSWAVFVGGELVASLERSKAVFPTGHRHREWGSGTLNQPNRKATTGSPPGLLATARGGWQESGVGRVRGRPTGWAAPH